MRNNNSHSHRTTTSAAQSSSRSRRAFWFGSCLVGLPTHSPVGQESIFHVSSVSPHVRRGVGFKQEKIIMYK
jgi:hypothetical protein